MCQVFLGEDTADTTKHEAWEKIYRATATKVNDLVHTKLDVKFDYSKAWMYGKAWITLHPHFYPTDTLNLDAKAMNINEVFLVKGGKNIPLKYTYDSMNLRITLDRNYKAGEDYTIYIDYVSKPMIMFGKLRMPKDYTLLTPREKIKISPRRYGHLASRNTTLPGIQPLISPIKKQRMKSFSRCPQNTLRCLTA